MGKLDCKTCCNGSGDYQCAGCVRQELDIEIRRLTKENKRLNDEIGIRKMMSKITTGISLEGAIDQRDNLREALEKLAKLGNGDYYGNSDGNIIAIEALKQ